MSDFPCDDCGSPGPRHSPDCEGPGATAAARDRAYRVPAGTPVQCGTCKGTGYVLCRDCKGRGVSRAFILPVACENCNAQGSVPCPDCRGRGSKLYFAILDNTPRVPGSNPHAQEP